MHTSNPLRASSEVVLLNCAGFVRQKRGKTVPSFINLKVAYVSAFLWFCYVVYNSSKLNGFNNCTFLPNIVVITLGNCAHRSAPHVLAS
jgi:hypothetical protein